MSDLPFHFLSGSPRPGRAILPIVLALLCLAGLCRPALAQSLAESESSAELEDDDHGIERIVYDNSTYYLGKFFATSDEFGDELMLYGTARTVTEFSFEYYGAFTSNGDETARVRFYRNDGPLFTWPGSSAPTPATLLYDSGNFPINPGYNSRTISGLHVHVPENFTWTVQFGGLTGAADDQAGLLLYAPATVGLSFNDFWWKKSAAWGLFDDPSVKDNFGSRVKAVHSSEQIFIKRFNLGTNGMVIDANVPAGHLFALDYCTNLTYGLWTRLPQVYNSGTTSLTLKDTNALKDPLRVYRVTDLGIPPPEVLSLNVVNGVAHIQGRGQAGKNYALEFSVVGSTLWTRLPGTLLAKSSYLYFTDPTNLGVRRLYRIVEVPQTGPPPFPVIHSIKVTSGLAEVFATVTAGKIYALEFRPSVTSTQWTLLPDSRALATNGAITLRDATVGSVKMRFYRVVEYSEIDPAPKPGIKSIALQSGKPAITFSAIAGSTYALEYISDVTSTNWVRLTNEVYATTNQATLIDAQASGQRFYRVVRVRMVATIKNLRLDGTRALVTASALPARGYALEYRDALGTGTWTRIAGQTVALGHTVTLIDPSISRRQRFYRVVWVSGADLPLRP